MEPTEDDQVTDPDVQIIVDNFAALATIRDACHRLGWRGEWYQVCGLMLQLAMVAEGECVPGLATEAMTRLTEDIP